MTESLLKAIDLTKQFIAMRADHTEGANASIKLAADYLVSHGREPQVFENQGHLMLVCEIGQGQKTLLLNGHLDVVAGQEEQYSPMIEGDHLIGRGSYDMIAACAVMIQLVCDLPPEELKTKVILTLSSTEETAGHLCTGYILEQGVTGDFAICGEPTNLAVSVMSKGVLRMKFLVPGKAAHSSRPWLGENALIKAFELYRRIEALPFVKHQNRFFNGASVNLSKVSGGIVMNQVPDRAEMVVDIRYVPGDDPNEILEQIKALDDSVEVEMTHCIFAVEVDEQDPRLQMLTQAVRDCCGNCAVIAQHGAADTACFQEKGIPSVEFGPCGAGHHGKSEYVEISSLETYRNILLKLIDLFAQK